MEKKIVFIQPAYARYRQPLFDLLCKNYATRFFFIEEPPQHFQKKSSNSSQPKPSDKSRTPGSRAFHLFQLFKRYLRLIVFLVRSNDSIIITSISDSPQTMLSLLISRIKRKKCALMIEEWFFPAKKSLESLFRLLLREHNLKCADAVVAVGTAQRNYVMNFGVPSEKVFLANHCSIDLSKYRSENLKQRLKIEKYLVVLYLGRIIRNKGLDFLIHAFSKLEQERNDVFLLIGGDGDFRPHCESLARELDIEHISFVGTVYGEENLASYYKTADVFVFPSCFRGYSKLHVEGWGLVINEAMSMGRPVVTTNAVGAALDLVKNGINGYVVKNQDSQAICMALKKVLEDSKLREAMGKNSRKIFEEFNDFNKMFEGFRQAIDYVSRYQNV
jgi:glycosyltransferase involved in cell wall biosynthesis